MSACAASRKADYVARSLLTYVAPGLVFGVLGLVWRDVILALSGAALLALCLLHLIVSGNQLNAMLKSIFAK